MTIRRLLRSTLPSIISPTPEGRVAIAAALTIFLLLLLLFFRCQILRLMPLPLEILHEFIEQKVHKLVCILVHRRPKALIELPDLGDECRRAHGALEVRVGRDVHEEGSERREEGWRGRGDGWGGWWCWVRGGGGGDIGRGLASFVTWSGGGFGGEDWRRWWGYCWCCWCGSWRWRGGDGGEREGRVGGCEDELAEWLAEIEGLYYRIGVTGRGQRSEGSSMRAMERI